MRKVTGKIVNTRQHALITSRQILDASLIANECINSYLKSKHCGVLCRRIIENAFEGTDLSFQDFKLYFLKISYSWSHVRDGGTNLTVLNFVDNIMQGA